MIYYFGWINLSIDLDNDDSTSADTQKMISSVNELIGPLKKYSQLCEIRQMGLIDTLFISGANNHDIGYKDDVLRLFENIGNLAPGSYGLLYLRLPEDEDLHNEFLVYRLAKGILSAHKERLLSPCDPIIENTL